jgi:hypothetical protein
MGPVACASLKATTLLFLTHDVFIVCASMMPEPHRRGHMATVIPSISGQLVVFWVARASPTTVDPWSCSLRYKTKPDPVSEGSAPNLAPLRRQLHDLLLRPDVYYLYPLGSASWCTCYGSARKRNRSNQPIFLFPNQNGRRFDWRPSEVGVPCCSTRSFWTPGD